ncbi:hypothetical protein B0H16DRAFT_256245 [Mycena metata]|uniref:F-box domain-containing protein n=1 Tax=Mycena metata TaxID=1033252 RepID=A0AAD7NNZ8_9AGAR|nr:hypothetical protein B0H16DRAFT_256245 [Mycena metata]
MFFCRSSDWAATASWSRLKQVVTRALAGRRRSASPSSTQSPRMFLGPDAGPTDAALDSGPIISFHNPPVERDHNRNLPISRLPRELLAEIFILWCERCDIEDSSWVSCSRICSSWRRIALDTAPLWSHIIFKSAEWMRLCIQRSKSSLLIIDANIALDPLHDALICEALTLLDKIGTIRLRVFSQVNSDRLLESLAGPFPMLSSLTIGPAEFPSPFMPFDIKLQAYPNLRALSVGTHTRFILPLPTPNRLVSLELYNSRNMADFRWSKLTDVLQLLVELERLVLRSFPVPAVGARISLPNLRDLHLTGSPLECRQLVQTLECPLLRSYNIDLYDVDFIEELFQCVPGNLSRDLKSMFLHRGSWLNGYGPAPVAQDAQLGFAYADARNLNAPFLDINFFWGVGLVDSQLAKILAAVSKVSCIDTVQWLLLRNWDISPQGSWRALLQRLCRLRTLIIVATPASGLIWDLAKQLESPTAISGPTFCPELTEIQIDGVICSTGGWMPQTRDVNCNSYVDLDGARFIEVLIHYLELRPAKLSTLKITGCCNYSVAEIKLLRLLVTQVFWDGTGMCEATYVPNGDAFSAMTISHHLLDSRPGYDEVNLTDEQRRKRQTWAWRPNLSDRPQTGI